LLQTYPFPGNPRLSVKFTANFYCPYPSLHHIYIGLIPERANIYQSRPGSLDLPFDINFIVFERKIEGLADWMTRRWFKCVFGCFSEDSFLSSLTERQTLLKQKLDSKCFRFFGNQDFRLFNQTQNLDRLF
jgi:hypothetical protein